MSLLAYKLLHVTAVLYLFAALGAIAVHAANGGRKDSNTARRLVGMVQGIALVVLLVTGFGAVARLGAMGGSPFPGWVWGKLAIWLVLGLVGGLPYRRPHLARPFFYLLPLLGGVAVYLALFKPF